VLKLQGRIKLENQDLAKLFFELASESRLSILNQLQGENLKMQEIAKRLDVTATEAFRQLERLSAALLVQRQPEGSYAITQYGKLVLGLSVSLDFSFKYKDYFSKHGLSLIPAQFIHRLGELSEATLITDTMETLNKAERMFIDAKQYGWGLAEGVVPELMGPPMTEKLLKGIKFKFLLPQSRLPKEPLEIANMELRGIPEVPLVIALTEKEAAVCFRANTGKIDYAGFYGTDETFLCWARDLFLYFWDRGQRI
jgi:predicted transcriptional regulator